ncbi:CCR4-NOT transcription complex subunit 1 [Phytophthora cinnamomi]|uniref:CCR4-NOT transcription complex subunit 1 n=1 Tax=Phytophthora cinnamomi TaxID=4785 RepID=UPI00355A1938|nr:CCR4-NOT transcription complex subunit 1 [Phytophthora cinnamomi]
MVSFASPLFWQINYLVTNLSKKNFKSNVAELSQLVELYGEDARIFLLNCLVKDIDFRDARGQKDALKIQLLTHEVAQASSRPNFTTFICEAIEGSSPDAAADGSARLVSEEFLQLFCKTLKLSLPQQVTVGLAFAQGENAESAAQAIRFLRAKIPEISSCDAKLPSDVLHSLVFVLRMKKEFHADVAETDSFLASISSAHPNDMGSLEMAPLTMGDPEHVDCEPVTDSAALSKLISDVSSSCLFYELMEDVGYSCTSSPQAFRTLLAEAGLAKAPTIPPAQVAGMLAMLSRTYTGLDAENGATLMANLTIDFEATPSDEAAAAPARENWDLEVIADVLQKDYSSIKWTKVAEKLDRADLNIQNAAQLRVLITAFQRFSQTKFRVTTLLRPWKNSRAHISILKAAVEAPPEVLSFSESLHKLAPFEGADASAVPKNGVWFSLDVVETLLQVSEQDCYGDVRKLLDGAMKTCPDVLIANLAQASPRWNALRDDMFSELFSTYIMGRPNAPLIMRHLWSVAPKLVLYASVKCFYAATAPHIVSRLFALFRNTGDAFASAIHSNYFSFALALATMGANHDVLNLETWLVERLASQRTAFATSCLAFVHRNYARAVPKSNITPQSSHVLSIESLATILKCIMAVQGALPVTIAQELKRIITLCMETHPVISASTRPAGEASNPHVPGAAAGMAAGAAAAAGVGAGGESSASGGDASTYTAEMIEEQANAYFQQIYTSEQNINDVVAMLKRFQGSRDERERQIFYCMIHNLFDEYRFFPRYPEMELRITGVLFGKLIEHQVLPPNFLQTALRSVLESLREPVNSKFFFFGACALQQFVPRLRELPAYCTNLSQIPHLQHALPEIMRQVNQVTRSIALSGSSLESNAGNGAALSSLGGSLPPLGGVTDGDSTSRLAATTGTLGAGSPPRAGSGQKAQDDIALGIQIPSSILSRSAGPSLTTPSPKAPAGSPPPPAAPAPELKVDHIFHESSMVDENEVVEQPDENVKDRIHFIVNNMSISNLEAKIPEVRKMLLPTYHAWLANYLVVKRISTQPNYHTVYLIFIEKLMRPELEREILKRTLQNARKLLTSGTITTNSQQRSLLKNLGSWLGVFTLARNKPLLQRDLDLKELLYVGYETGHLIAVTPFVAKILEGCKKSKIFKPPNPWVMGLIHAMSEIYDVPDLKLNLKFEIEVLFKSFKLNVEDQRKAQLLHTRRAPPRTANPDFNVKVPKNTMMGQRSATPPPGSGSKLGRPLTPGKPMKNVPAGSPTGREGMTGYGSLGANSAGGGAAAESTVIPNLASYVAVNPELPLRNVNLRRLVPLAVDRAIREVISPVVERSVTIACITTREVILKDFATESDDTKMRKAAHLMVASMSGSLALITAKEPLRNAIGTHLRALLPTSAGDPQQLEHVIQVCSNENTDLGCMLIEKASSEKAMRDIDEALAGAYASRRRYQQQQAQAGKVPGADGVHFFEGSASSTAVAASAGSPGAPSGHWPAALPEVFKPKPGGVPPMQLVVYEAFQRIPRPTSMPLSSRAGAGAYPGASVDKEGDTAGVSVTAALDRFAGLLERFELFVQKVARQAAAAQRELPSLLAIPAESEVFAVLREVRALGGSVRPALRDEACLKIANRIVKFMYELGNGGRGNELFLEILVSSLEALTASCEKLRKEIVGWVLRAPVDDKLKLHCEIIVALIRYKVVEATEFDVYLARNMERNSVAIEFAVHVVRQCLVMEHVAVAAQLPNTLEALARIVERHGGAAANKNVQILAALLEQARVQKLQNRPAPPAPQKSMGAIGSGAAKAGGERPLVQEHAAFRHTVSNALEHWIAIYKEPTGNSKMHAQYLQMLKQYGLLADDESVSLFFKFGTELCVDACLKSSFAASDPAALKAGAKVPLNYAVLDALTHLMALLVKYLDPSPAAKLQVLNHAVGAIANVLVAAHDLSRKKKAPFDQRVFFRMFVNLMKELTAQEPALDAIHLQVLNTFASAYNTLQPLGLPGFVFAWTELISHRCFMPLLLRAKQQRGWQILHRLLMNLLVFMEPFLRHANSAAPLPDSIAALYKGVVRIILVLLHDYPDFLSDFYTSFCDVLPAACVQLRNVILSAFSRSMRLPDPLTLGLQVAQLPEVSVAPRLMPAWGAALTHNGIKEYADEFLHATANRASVFPADLISKLLRPAAQLERDPTSCKYALPALNALVLYLGKEGIADMANGGSSTPANAPPTLSGADGKAGDGSTSSKFEQSAAMDVFRYLADELDTEGRYWYFSSLANHLRYPNSHTHYFSCVILYLFSYSSNKMVKEQITRVLIERLIANRPHPWGLLVTFIELIRNKSYKFWEQDYLECSSEIKEVFDDVARTCLGTTPGASGASPLASLGGSALPSASPSGSS